MIGKKKAGWLTSRRAIAYLDAIAAGVTLHELAPAASSGSIVHGEGVRQRRCCGSVGGRTGRRATSRATARGGAGDSRADCGCRSGMDVIRGLRRTRQDGSLRAAAAKALAGLQSTFESI